jgi:prophage maintenance system killer protein
LSASARLFIELNGWTWRSVPSVDDSEHAVLAAASGEWERDQVSAWLRERIAASGGT